MFSFWKTKEAPLMSATPDQPTVAAPATPAPEPPQQAAPAAPVVPAEFVGRPLLPGSPVARLYRELHAAHERRQAYRVSDAPEVLAARELAAIAEELGAVDDPRARVRAEAASDTRRRQLEPLAAQYTERDGQLYAEYRRVAQAIDAYRHALEGQDRERQDLVTRRRALDEAYQREVAILDRRLAALDDQAATIVGSAAPRPAPPATVCKDTPWGALTVPA